MGLVFTFLGIAVAFLSWVSKGEWDYIERKNYENSIDKDNSIIGKRNKINEKMINKENITYSEFFSIYSHKFIYGILSYGIYIGLALSVLGFILLIINSK